MRMSKRVLYVASVVKTHIMHFHLPYLKMFQAHGWHTSVAARNDYNEPADCKIPYCDEYFDVAFDRSPCRLNNIRAYRQLKRIIDEGRFDIVHCHTPVASVLTRLAVRKSRNRGTKVFYTAHGFHFFKGAPLLNWLVYFPVEWLCSFMTDTLITINREDYALAKKHMHAKHTAYVPGVGIDIEKYQADGQARARVRKALGIDEDATILLSVGELSDRKNHQMVIRAVGTLGTTQNIHYLIAGKGKKQSSLAKLAKAYGAADRVHLLGYRSDVSELYAAADLFVLPSYQEGLSLALMEAMLHKLPCVVSRIRGNVELMDARGGRLFDPYSMDELKRALNDVMNCDREKMGQHNCEKVMNYALDGIMEKMNAVYELR